MKTKLLKKVRSRYSIVRIDAVGTGLKRWYVYVIRIKYFPFCEEDEWTYPTYNYAYSALTRLIREEYSRKTNKKAKEVKVWYNK